MSTSDDIKIHKTLHHRDAFVQSVDYTALSAPVLTQTITVDGKISVGSEGKTLVRRSEDNGGTWCETGEWHASLSKTVRRYKPMYLCVPEQGALLEFFNVYEIGPGGDYVSFGPANEGMPRQARTCRVFYRVSRDEGRTWSADQQVIQHGGGYDAVNWADGLQYERNSGFAMPPKRLRDGTIAVPICVNIVGADGGMVARTDRFGEKKWPVEGVALLRGHWSAGGDLRWSLSTCITVPEYMSYGLTEPAVAEMNGDRLMVVMRSICGPRQALPSVKFFAISEDGGATWSEPVPLTHPDCSYVYSPGSYLNFFRSDKNDRVYLITNILPGPTRSGIPRYPLNIVEVDRDFLWALPWTATVIQEREPRHSKLVRFSNWRGYEDRESGNPVIFMTEDRADTILPDPEDKPLISDAYRYEIDLPT